MGDDLRFIHFVIPAKAGIQSFQGLLDSRLRGNDVYVVAECMIKAHKCLTLAKLFRDRPLVISGQHSISRIPHPVSRYPASSHPQH